MSLRSFLVLSTCGTIISFLGCTLSQPAAKKPEKQSTEAPTVRLHIAGLTNGSPVGGTTVFRPRLKAKPRLPSGFRLKRLTLFVNGNQEQVRSNRPWYLSWNTLPLTNGSTHQVQIVSLDSRGKTLRSPSLQVKVSNIRFTIYVKVPPDTPQGEYLYICGNKSYLGQKYSGEWNPRAVRMQRAGKNLWKKSIYVGFNDRLEYEFTRASWATKGRKKDGSVLHPKTRVLGRSEVRHHIDNWGTTKGKSGPKAVCVHFGADAATSAAFFWETAQSVKGKVSYGTAADRLDNTVADRTATRIHRLCISSLRPATRYYYRTSTSTNVYSFHTAPKRDVKKEFTFITVGDFQGRNRVTGAIKKREQPDFLVHSGDMVNDGWNHTLWNQYFRWIHPLACRYPIMTVPGNHEHEAVHYYRFHPMPGNGVFYTFDYGNTRFFMLNSERDFSPISPQYKWLVQALKKSQKVSGLRWRIAVFHTPPYSTGKHLSDTVAQKYLVPLFEKYGINLVVNGHDHAYQITKPWLKGKENPRGIVYIVSGGSGAWLYDFREDAAYIAFRKKIHHYSVFQVSHKAIVHTAKTPDGKILYKKVIWPRRP